jgi:predicted dehydrogenase
MGSLHARVLANAGCLARVVDPDERAGRSVAEKYGVPWAPELTLGQTDAVVLAAPTHLHHPLALDVLGAGLPLLVEKPLCDDLERACDVVRLAERRDLPLMCGLLERYNPAVRTAAALVTEPAHLSATRHSPYVPRIHTGVGWDLSVHDVDIAIRCFGVEPSRVSATTGCFHPRSAREDVLDAVLEFPGGIASVSVSRLRQRKVRSLVIAEVGQVFEVDLLRRTLTIHRNGSVATPELVSTQDPLTAQLDRFLGLLDGTVDVRIERDSILPAHRVVAAALKT